MTAEANAHKYVTLLRDRDWRAAAAAHEIGRAHV